MMEAALLDVDGTLIDDNLLHVLAWSRAFRRIGHEIDAGTLLHAIGMGSDRFVHAVLGDIDEATAERARGYHAEDPSHTPTSAAKFPPFSAPSRQRRPSTAPPVASHHLKLSRRNASTSSPQRAALPTENPPCPSFGVVPTGGYTFARPRRPARAMASPSAGAGLL